MIALQNLISYVLQPQFQPNAEAGEHFESLAMCEHCRLEAAGGEVPSFTAHVSSIFSKCREQNGCVVCGFCGVAMLDLMTAGAKQGVVPDCPRCGAVVYVRAADFQPVYGDDEEAEAAYVDWHRRMRCLELFAVAAGLSVCAARDSGTLLDTEEIRQLFHSALVVTRLNEADECINHFFDHVQETIRIAEQSGVTAHAPLRAVENDETEVASTGPPN